MAALKGKKSLCKIKAYNSFTEPTLVIGSNIIRTNNTLVLGFMLSAIPKSTTLKFKINSNRI